MSGREEFSPLLKQRIFEAVQAELRESGVDRFRIERVAQRAEVEPSVIRARWHDRRVLLMETMLARTKASAWSADTGSLHTDLESVAALATRLSQTASDRALFRRVLPGEGDADLAEISSDLWTARFLDGAKILERAAGRGQLRDGIDPVEAIRMLTAAFYFDVIFSDAAVRPEYGEQVIDIFKHGVLGAGGRDRPWLEAEQFLHRHDPDAGAAAIDNALEVARSALVLTRVWADALIDPLVLLEAARDEHGRIVDLVYRDANRAACAIIGLPRAEVLGRGVVESSPRFRETGLLEQYADVLDREEPIVFNELPYRHFDQERRLDIRLTSAGPGLFTVTWRDVTDRYLSTKRDQRYRQLMDFSIVPAALATPDGRFVSVNQAMADYIGYDIETLLTMSWQDLVPPEYLPEQLQNVTDLLAGGTDSYRGIKQYLRPDGRRVWGDLSVSCIRAEDGQLEHFIAQVIDVTALVNSRREIAKRDDRVSARGPAGVSGATISLVFASAAAATGALRRVIRALSPRARRR